MLDKLNEPETHEIIGRTIVNTVKLGIVAALFLTLQKQFYQSSNELITTVDRGIASLID